MLRPTSFTLGLFVAALMLAAGAVQPALAMGDKPQGPPEPGDVRPAATIPDMEEAAGHLIHLGARITFETAKGPFTIVTFPREAPKTVEQIVRLTKGGFYTGLAVHRVVPNVAVQLGDPATRTLLFDDPKVGRNGSGQTVPPEYEGQTVRFLPGAVGLARAKAPGSGDSQLFVTLVEAPYLDEQYTVFGLVTKGMDNVRKLVPGDKIIKASISLDDPAIKPSPSPSATAKP